MLKNIIHHALKLSSSQRFTSRPISTSLTHFCFNNNEIVQHKRDDLTTEIENARNSIEILNQVGAHPLNTRQVIACLWGIFEHEKQKNPTNHSEILRHPHFEDLCRNLKREMRKLTINEIILAIEALSHIGVASDSRIITSLLSMVRHQLNDLPISKLIKLNFLLKKMKRTPLVDGLDIALPLVFENQLPMKIARDDEQVLNYCLAYILTYRVTEQTKNIILTALVLLEDLQPKYAMNILCNLVKFSSTNEIQEKLVSKCFQVVNSNLHNERPKSISSLIYFIWRGMKKGRDIYCNLEFMEKSAKIAVRNKWNLEEIYKLLHYLHRLNFVDVELLNYFTELLAENPSELSRARVGYILTIIESFGLPNYKPPKWEILKPYIAENPIFNQCRSNIPLLNLILNSLILDIWRPSLVEKAFQSEYLDKKLPDAHMSEHRSLLILYQAVNTIKKDSFGKNIPQLDTKYLEKVIEWLKVDNTLEPILKHIFGDSKVIFNVKTRLGHKIDHVVILNENHEELKENFTVEDLQEKGYKLFAVVKPHESKFCFNVNRLKGVYDLEYQTLDTILPVVIVNHETFESLLDREKISYIERLINEKMPKT